jgi:hypothetical protein
LARTLDDVPVAFSLGMLVPEDYLVLCLTVFAWGIIITFVCIAASASLTKF